MASGDSESRAYKKSGTFRSVIRDVSSITLADFENPWNFFNLFLNCDRLEMNTFLRREGLLSSEIDCPKCDGLCTLRKKMNAAACEVFRCKNNRNHEFSAYKFSFFEKCKIDIPDIMLFVVCYLDNMSLKQCAAKSGIDYLPINAWFWGYYALRVLLWEA